jgi:CDP-glycerol glycerophosphotransferase
MNASTSANDRLLYDIKTIVSSGLFDQDYYRATYPDVVEVGMHPIEHYVRYGASEGRFPRKDFDPIKYCAQHPQSKSVNTFVHFIEGMSRRHNDQESKAHAPDFLVAEEGTHSSKAVVAQLSESGLFDVEYYLKAYPDVAQLVSDPVRHFVEHGSGEFRNPSFEFDTCWYWLIHQQNECADVNPLLHYHTTGKAAELSIKPKDKSELLHLDDACKKFMLRKPSLAASLLVAAYLERIGRLVNAEQIFSHICSLGTDPEHLHTLARLYVAQRKWWQAIDTLQIACNLSPERAEWLAKRGELCEKMNRIPDAIIDYTKALKLKPKSEQWLYRLGFLHSQLGDEYTANQYYEQSVKLSADDKVIRLGVGIHHQTRGLWQAASEAYAAQLERDPLNADLHYHLGMAYDRCFEWEQAARNYKRAIAIDATRAYWFYRLGFVLERSKQYEEAATAYQIAGNLSSKHEAYWFYRQGYALQQAGKFQESCIAYLNTVKNPLSMVDYDPSPENLTADVCVANTEEQDNAAKKYIASLDRLAVLMDIAAKTPTWPQVHLELAEELERRRQWREAADAYGRGIARSGTHMQASHYKQGYCLARLGAFEEACSAFERSRIIKKAYGFDYSKYEKNASLKNAIEYNELIETLPVDDNVVLYESYHGASVSCNPFAIYTALSSNAAYRHLTHIWALNDVSRAPKEMRKANNVIFVERGSHLYRRYVATAKYLINNNTFMPWFVRRPEQKYLNTWHGTPMKGLGKDIKSTFMSHKNVSRNFLHATHLLSPNSHTSDVMVTRHDIAGAFTGIVAETGYPRNDRVLSNQGDEQRRLTQRLKLDPTVPTVLYAPTWRGTTSDTIVDVDRLVHDLEALAALNCNLLFRGHHMSEELIAAQGFKSVPADVETSELLSATDILVTDYSSICFDFMPTGKPVIYYAYDYDEYRQDRGMYLDIHTLPGVVVQDCLQLCEAIEIAFGRLDEKLEISTDNLKYLDKSYGAATQRAIDLLFHDDRTHAIDRFNDSRESILIYAGALPANGITQSCLSLINAIDSTRYRVVLVIDPDTIEAEQYRLDKLASIRDKVQIISRVGVVNYSPEEKLVIDLFNAQNTLYSESMWSVYRAAMRKEFHRVFGCAKFDTIIQFEGYGKFWTGLLGYGTHESNKIIYLHNNMLEEQVTKYEFLTGIFKLYPSYQKLVSVSESVNEENIKNLAELTGAEQDRFTYCDNYVNVAEILEKAEAPLDLDIREWKGASKLFGTVGRLSPEKGHHKLITAFNEVLKTTDVDAKLVIVGDGSQWSTLQQYIFELGLSEQVLLAGIRPNPYPIIKAMDLFIFSSDHEGQGLAIIEALILNKPVVSTDIPGPHSILKPGHGTLVENSVKGLVDGIINQMTGALTHKPFLPKHYNSNVDKQFLTLISK